MKIGHVVAMMNHRAASRTLAAFACLAFLTASASAGLHLPGSVPWPGGLVPYEFVGVLTGDQQQAYIDGLREWELAANVHFVARTTEPQWVQFKYVLNGPNRYTESTETTPRLVEIGQLTRGQVCHEMGHCFGLEHEHQRANRNAYITVNYGYIDLPDQVPFNILPTGIQFGNYDFESVMHYGRDVLSNTAGKDTIVTNTDHEKYQVRLSNVTLSPVDRAHMASLYGAPPVPLSSVVTTTADGGVGSLRAAIYYVQDHPGTTVTFNIPTSDPGYASGAFTIKPTGHLPIFTTNGLTIDATTQPGYAGKPVIFVNGSKLVTETGEIPAFLFLESNCTVKGLGVQQYPWCGMVMRYPDATGNRVAGCSIGLDATGNLAAPNVFEGIQISEGAHGNFIGGTGTNERNVISGNTLYGIHISGDTTTGNVILGNYIGTNLDGNAALPNHKGGVILIDGANHNTVGGDTAASRNIISGNTDAGIWIIGPDVTPNPATANTVKGNYIGTDVACNAAVPNTVVGVYVVKGATNNVLANNLLSGNIGEGLRIADSGTTGNVAYGNIAGLSAAGNTAVPNGFAGITVVFGATGNQVGGPLPGQGNVLSGNNTVGLSIGSTGTQGNHFYGNYIGTDPTGLQVRANGFAGVYVTGGCTGNYLGNGPGTGNLISGNGAVGVYVANVGTTGNFIRNNLIGPSANGAATSPQQGDGIWFLDGSTSNTTGGPAAGAANIITGNAYSGIVLYDAPPAAPTAGQTFQRNSIFQNGYQPVALVPDADHGDAIPNHGQSAPVLGSAVLTTATTVTGTLSSTANKSFTIDFYSGRDAAEAGRNFIGSTAVTTNGSGTASINVALPAIAKSGYKVCATATSQATGDTSEYSASVGVTSTDTDSDGMPNAYEAATPGLSTSNPLDAALDNDGDGFNNLQEFVSGTNSNNSSSRLVTAGELSGGNFVVSWASVAGKFYRVERSDSLPGSWQAVALHVEGTGGSVQVQVPVTPSTVRQFFRVTAGE